MDPKRSFIESARSYPDNIETRVTVTYDAGQVPIDNALSTISMILHHSMVRLPEKPMIPRLYDERVSFFSNAMYDYGLRRSARRTRDGSSPAGVWNRRTPLHSCVASSLNRSNRSRSTSIVACRISGVRI